MTGKFSGHPQAMGLFLEQILADRINTSEFGGDRTEMGATWIHGIGDNPVHKIANEINYLESDQPWECMDGFLEESRTVAEGGFELNPSLGDSILNLFKNLMDFAQDKVLKFTGILFRKGRM
ncbi:probable polyamine oxidase 5 [Mercurialis annua]|uniref:probable polyamine oxidase 5 n=1 Tax=Mercurialis annua TaxID=3986 RepID=UPI0021607E86|nr:probable polyamine oxidase 5 [Mercurialis annua]